MKASDPHFCVCNEHGPCMAHDPRYGCADCEMERECESCGHELEDEHCARHGVMENVMEDAAKIKAASIATHGKAAP